MTRRKLFKTSAAWVAGAAVGGGALSLPFANLAHADPVAAAELAKPGALTDNTLGQKSAPVTIVEYSSMTCAHCAQFTNGTFPAFKARYIDTGMVFFTFREFPLDDLSALASMLARSVSPDKFFHTVDTLFQQQRQWVSPRIQPLMSLATAELGFTEPTFKTTITNSKLLADIKTIYDRGSSFGVNSTPSFFINGERYSGAKSITEFDKLLAPLLKT